MAPQPQKGEFSVLLWKFRIFMAGLVANTNYSVLDFGVRMGPGSFVPRPTKIVFRSRKRPEITCVR